MNEVEFSLKYREYAQSIFNIAYGYTRNKCDAEDIVQEVFLKYLNMNKNFLRPEEEKYYLIRMTINFCKNYVNSAYKKKVVLDQEIIYTAADKKIRNDILARTILTLPAKYREVIILFYYDSISLVECAKYLKISVAAAKKRLERGRIMLKERLMN